MSRVLCATVLFLASTSFLPRQIVADDWPQWRGPQRDGVWRESGVLESLPEGQLEVKWSVPISSGYGGPTVADGRVYVTDRVVDGREQIERVHCFRAEDGELVWRYNYNCPYVDVSYDAGPRSSVTVFDGRAYSLGTMANFICFDAELGEVLWQKRLLEEYKIKMPSWGITCSPLIYEDFVIVQIGGADGANLVAFDRVTGKESWRALDDPPSYSSPLLIEQAGRKVLVCWTGSRVVGMNPADGKLFWEYAAPPKRFVRNCASPVWSGEYLLCSSFFDGAFVLRVPRDRLVAEEVWRRVGESDKKTDAIHTNVAEPLIQGDHIYGVDSYGEVRCLSLATGERVWESVGELIPRDRWSTMRFYPNGDVVWLFTELGELVIARFSPEGHEELSRTKLIKPTKRQLPSRRNGVCWSSIAFAQKHVFARSDEELVCASVAARE